MNRSIGVFICTMSSLLFAIAACGQGLYQGTRSTSDTTQVSVTNPSKAPNAGESKNRASSRANVIISTASWLDAYDFDELVNSSDLIVEGTIEKIEETRVIPPLDIPTIFTDYRLEISKVLKSYPGFDQQSIVVIQYGGTYKDTTRMMEGNDLFQVGEQVILFLRDASDDPVHTAEGETKFAVMMPGGRFTIKDDGILDTPTKDSPVADEYRGKKISDLENNIVASIPDSTYYVRNAAPAFLIVEGIVGDPQSRLIKTEDTQSVYTVYPFQVEGIVYDALQQSQDAARKTKIYQHSPVDIGDEISVFERGGTYHDITQRWAWSWQMKPGTRMLLFLGALECGDRPVLCTQEELDSKKLAYFAGGGARFIVNPDNTLTAVTRDFFSRLYDGVSKEKLVQDLADARASIQKELDAKQNQPTRTDALPPPPTETK